MMRQVGSLLCLTALITHGLVGSVWANTLRCPNVVLLLADDLGYGDLQCYGHPTIKTPRIDQLADQGIRFTSFYAAAPMCSPSRAGLLTGRSPHRTGIYDWIAHDGTTQIHLLSSEVTFASLLREAGYQTALHGKWHLNSSFNSSDQPQPIDHGFDYWFATQFNPPHLNPQGFVRNGKKLPDQQGYSCHIVVEDAIAWLQNRKPEQPFFQFISFHEPHHPIVSPPELVEKYINAGASNAEQAIYFASVDNLDSAVGTYLQALDELGLAHDTLVVFTSDHGPQSLGQGVFRHSYGSAGRLQGRKRCLWEGGIRVPGIIRWPRAVTRARTDDTPIAFVDFAPTLSTLCGYELPSQRVIDGTDISPLLRGDSINRKQPLHWHFYSPLSGPQSVLREGRWVLTASWDVGISGFRKGTRHIPEFERLIKRAELTQFGLFDILEDPRQSTNLASVHPKLVNRLASQLEAIHREVRDEAPLWGPHDP